MHRAAGLACLALPATVIAHVREEAGSVAAASSRDGASWSDVAASGAAVPWSVVVPLAVVAILYLCGVARLWRPAGAARGISRGAVACFAGGWITLAIALLSPLDTLGADLFWVHMVQHEVLMLAAAPLLVLGKPLQAMLWAFPARGRRALGTAGHALAGAGPWRALTSLRGSWVLHAVTLWVWHAPPLFDAALARPLVHDLQHVSFLGGALAFWWALLAVRSRSATGVAVLCLFTTMLHTGALGALLTFSRVPWYAGYEVTAPLHGLSALEDQQLGGLVMWVPGSLAYVGGALALLARGLGAPARRLRPPAS